MKSQLYLFLFMLFGVISHAQTPEQIEVFKKELLTACNEEKPDTFTALLSTDGNKIEDNKGLLRLWRGIAAVKENTKISQLEYYSKADLENQANEDSFESDDHLMIYEIFDQTRMIRSSGLCYDIPPVGMVSISSDSGSLMFDVAFNNGKFRIPKTRQATQEERAEADLIAKRRNPSLITLKDSIDAANKLGKQVSLIVVTRGKGDKFMVNRKEVSTTSMKEVILDLAKKAGDKNLIIVVDCGSENKTQMELLETICDEGGIGDFSLITYQDAEISDDKSLKPSVQPNDQK